MEIAFYVMIVTPFVGVWIETHCMVVEYTDENVTPFVGVWIETKVSKEKLEYRNVTPFVGVWIETFIWLSHTHTYTVTPFVGVWIETIISQTTKVRRGSHPSWVCGLKLIRCRADNVDS